MMAIYVWERIGRCLSGGKCEKKMGKMKIWILEFFKLEIKFGNRKFEELFKCGILEINKIIITKIIMVK